MQMEKYLCKDNKQYYEINLLVIILSLLLSEEFSHNYICKESELKKDICDFEDQALRLEDEKANIINLLNKVTNS